MRALGESQSVTAPVTLILSRDPQVSYDSRSSFAIVLRCHIIQPAVAALVSLFSSDNLSCCGERGRRTGSSRALFICDNL